MLQRDEQQGQIVGPRLANVPPRVSDLRPAIRQENTEPITGHDKNRRVDLPVRERLAEVDKVDDDQIAASGELNLDAEANARSVRGMALGPVHVAGLLLRPARGALKARIDELPHSSPAVSVSHFLHAQRKILQDAPQLIEQRREAEALYPLANAVVRLLLDDAGHSVNRNAERRVGVHEGPRQTMRNGRLQRGEVAFEPLADSRCRRDLGPKPVSL